MVSKRMAARLWKPLLDAHADVVADGPWLYVKPVRHVVRALLLHSSRYDRRGRPEWAAVPLFEPARFFALDWGSDLTYEIPRSVPIPWDAMKTWSDAEHALWLKENYEAWVLPKLRGLGEIKAFFDFALASDRGGIHRAPVRILFHAALGEFDRVRELAAEYADGNVPESWLWPHCRPLLDLVREIIPLVEREDRTALAALLHRVEAETARNLGIEHIYERAPFPFQEAGNDARW
jgi:hypothetical protein